MANFKEASKQNWNSQNTTEHINAGSLQRIADATELMAKNFLQMQNDLEMYKRWYKERGDSIAKYIKTIRALRGQITKLKNKIK